MGTITRLHDSGTLGQAATSVAFAGPPGAVHKAFSVASTGSQLRISHWAISSAGVISLASTQTETRAVTQFGPALLNSIVVVACRDSDDGKLHVVSFDGSTAHGAAHGAIDDRRLSAVMHISEARWWVSFVTTGGDLKVEFWQFPIGLPPQPTFVSAATAGATSHISGCSLGNNLVTAVRTGGNLKLIQWAVPGPINQMQVTRVGDSGSQAGAVQDLAAAGFAELGVPAVNVVTAVKNNSGNLEIITWKAGAADITRVSSQVFGPVGEVAIMTFALGAVGNLGVFVTATTDGNGDLVVTSWKIAQDGNFSQLASANAGAASHVSIIDVDTDKVATTCITGAGIEKVIVWKLA